MPNIRQKAVLGAMGLAGYEILKPKDTEAMTRRQLIKQLTKAGYKDAATVAKTIPSRHFKELWGMHRAPEAEQLARFRSKSASALDELAELSKRGSVSPKIGTHWDKNRNMIMISPNFKNARGEYVPTMPIHEIGHEMATQVPDNLKRRIKNNLPIIHAKQPRLAKLPIEKQPDELLAETYALQKFGMLDNQDMDYVLGKSIHKSLSPYYAGKKGRGLYGESQKYMYDMPKTFKPLIEVKVDKRRGLGQMSSAAPRLVGQTFRGRVIGNVTQGKGDWRTIHYMDGTTEVMDKKEVSEIARAVGHKQYAGEKFSAGNLDKKFNMAVKRLELNYNQMEKNPFQSGPMVENQLINRQKQIQRIDKTLKPNESMVQYKNKSFSMPTSYAELLEQAGMLKILKKY